MHCNVPKMMNYNKKKKKMLQGTERDTLRLFVKSMAVPKQRRRLYKYPRIEVQNRNIVYGYINGQQCCFILDSGSEGSFMCLSQAERLGLITGDEVKVTMRADLWNGVQELEIMKVEDVVITLEGGVKVRTRIEVFPREFENRYDPNIVVLDVTELCRGAVVQTFNHRGSSIFIRRPKRLRQSLQQSQCWKTQRFCVQREGSGKPMTVLLDTGAVSFFVSESRM